MAKRRRRARRSSARKSRRGGASAPAACKSKLKSCLRSGPALHGPTAKKCFKSFNACR